MLKVNEVEQVIETQLWLHHYWVDYTLRLVKIESKLCLYCTATPNQMNFSTSTQFKCGAPI